MANIVIGDLEQSGLEFAELSNLELEAIAGGKNWSLSATQSQSDGASVKLNTSSETRFGKAEASAGYSQKGGYTATVGFGGSF